MHDRFAAATFAALLLASPALLAQSNRGSGAVPAVPAVPATAITTDVLEGNWMAGEPHDEIEFILRVRGTDVTVVNVRGEGAEEREDSGTVVALGDGHYELSIDDGGRPTRVHVMLTGQNEGLAWERGDDELFVLRRRTELPAWLAGDFTAVDPRGRDVPRTLTFDGNSLTLDVDGRSQRLRVAGLAPDQDYPDGRVPLAIAERGEQPQVYWLRPVPGGGWVLFREGDDDFRILYRGETPAWIAALGSDDDGGDDDGVCQRAADFMVACLVEACSTNSPPPNCANVDTYVEMIQTVPTCDESMREEAQMILELPCSNVARQFLTPP